MYQVVDLLPPNVKSALPSIEDQKKWMSAFNKSFSKRQSVSDATFAAWEMMKSAPSCRHFEGWMSTAHVDIQGDKMDQKALFKRLQKHIERGGTIVDVHSNRVLGSLYNVELKKYDNKIDGIYGRGIIYQDEPYFDKVWDEIKKGDKGGFSIGGFAVDWTHECDAHSCYRNVLDSSIHEVSICKTPADPYAKMTLHNTLAKSEETVTIPKTHLKKDKEKFLMIRQMIDELLADDDDAEGGIESKEPSGKEFQDAELETCGTCGLKKTLDPMEKVGTRVGVCRGHMQMGHKMSSYCQGVGFNTSTDRGSLDPGESGIIVDAPEDQVAHFDPQIFELEDKDLGDVLQSYYGIQENNKIKEINDKMSAKYAEYFAQARDKMDVDDKVKKAFNRAIKTLSEKNGLPVSSRLQEIDQMGCPKCKTIVGNIQRKIQSTGIQEAM